MSATPVILDTDPGIDDAVALMLALASPEIDLLGISTVGGNVARKTTFENAHRLLQLFEITDLPVGIGHPSPAVSSSRARHIHGGDGLGNTGLPLKGQPKRIPSVQLIDEILRGREAKTVLVTVGPLTNIAELLRLSPAIASRIARAVVMGGAVKGCGNVTPAAEANIYHSPEAAAAVISAGLPLRLVPLDATTQSLFTPRHMTRFSTLHSAQADFFRRMMQCHFQSSKQALSLGGSYIHDALAVAAVIDESLLRFEPVHCAVETRGEWTRGMTLCDFRIGSHRRKEPNIEVALAVDCDRFLDLVCNRLFELLSTFER